MSMSFQLPDDAQMNAVTFLTIGGVELCSTQGNLFDLIQTFERRFVVDTHVDWFSLSGDARSSKFAFVIGTTADREASPKRLHVENFNLTPKVRNNVFIFGLRPALEKDVAAGFPEHQLILQRLDEHATRVLDMQGLRAFEQNEGAHWDTGEGLDASKSEVLRILGIKSSEDLSRLGSTDTPQRLQARVRTLRHQCFRDFPLSWSVALHAYAHLLCFFTKARNEFLRPSYLNLLGDAQLVQNALYLYADILSRDEAVKRMARTCEIQCAPAPFH